MVARGGIEPSTLRFSEISNENRTLADLGMIRDFSGGPVAGRYTRATAGGEEHDPAGIDAGIVADAPGRLSGATQPLFTMIPEQEWFTAERCSPAAQRPPR